MTAQQHTNDTCTDGHGINVDRRVIVDDFYNATIARQIDKQSLLAIQVYVRTMAAAVWQI